jgi:glucokinase
MQNSFYPRLLGDVGGTNARFAWQEHPGAALSHVGSWLCKEHDSLLDAIQHHLQAHALPTPRACGIGIANPITGDRVQMTNHHWSFSIATLRNSMGVDRLVVINDFTAVALSLPQLRPEHLRRIGGDEVVAEAPRVVLGPGTGFGVSGLLTTPSGQMMAVNGEGGHATLPAQDAAEAAVIDVLRQRFGHVSIERALSGPGLVNLYEAVAAIEGSVVRILTPSEVVDQARHHGNAVCRRALDHFCALLGAVAGNIALTFGAHGGVYLAGGILPRIIDELESSLFRSRFDSKGRFGQYLARIPVFVIDSDVSPALLGASCALDTHD